MKTIIKEMVKNYQINDVNEAMNAIKEVAQEITLYALSNSDFFSHAAFYGGTALRIFYNLPRFSEDLDFSLKNKDPNFSFDEYIRIIDMTFTSLDFRFKVFNKEKTALTNTKTYYLEGNKHDLCVDIGLSEEITSHIQNEEVIKIKIEIDVNPPAKANYVDAFLERPETFKITMYDEPSMFAAKIHALLFRKRKTPNRIKGRDLYDFAFYAKRKTFINLEHLRARIIESNDEYKDSIFSVKFIKDLLKSKFKVIDYIDAKENVKRFINNENEIKYWGESYFLNLIDYLSNDQIDFYLVNARSISTDHGDYVEIIKKDLLLNKEVNNEKQFYDIFNYIHKFYKSSIIYDDDLLYQNLNKDPFYYYEMSCGDYYEKTYIIIDSPLGKLLQNSIK